MGLVTAGAGAGRTAIDPADVPVVILCGGQGTRLRDVTESLPKPLVDIGGQPVLWHVMKLYGSHGFRRFILCLGYRSWNIKEYFIRYRENLADFTVTLGGGGALQYRNDAGLEDWEVTLVETGVPTQTGGRLGRVAGYLEDADVFAVTYADGLGDVDLTDELRFHLGHGATGTVVGVHPTSRYGEMSVQGEVVTAFNEKPNLVAGYVSGGFFFFRHSFLDYVTEDESLVLEQGPLGKLAGDGELRTFPHDGFWMGMDTYREYDELNRLWASGSPPWRSW